MSRNTALEATRFYLERVAHIRVRNPARPALITFYGGEPLLNFPVIEAVVDYVRNRGFRNVTFSVSTNGLLLNDTIADFLVENEVSVAVSLDGPQPEHDRNRVNANGQGSFSRVFSNVERFRRRHPDYPHLIFLTTYDPATDFHELRRFFSERPLFQRSLILFSQVSPHFTDYYDRFSDETQQRTRQTLLEFKKDLARPGMKFGKTDPIQDFLFGIPLYLCMNRPLIVPTGRGPIPTTSTCIPGDKLCVLPNAEIQVCERATGLKIGSLDHGLDFNLIAKLIAQYNDAITSHCGDCPVTRLCGSCFATFWSGEKFRFPWDGFCKDFVEEARSTLQHLWSVLEANPAFFDSRETVEKLLSRRLNALMM
jgi:uncharacterized protein